MGRCLSNWPATPPAKLLIFLDRSEYSHPARQVQTKAPPGGFHEEDRSHHKPFKLDDVKEALTGTALSA
jgi:hypothetical protein